MSNILQQTLLLVSTVGRRTPSIQFQRFRGKINIQRPRQPHYERARVIAVTQPEYPEPDKRKNCFKRYENRVAQREQLENPYDLIIAREVRNWLENSNLVAIFHTNSITSDEMFRVRLQLHKQNMHLKSYGKKIIAKAVENSRFEAILPLFQFSHCIVFSPEQQVNNLLRITRKVSQLVLLAGIVDNTLLSRNEMLAYAQLPSLQNSQAELVQTLNAAAGNLVQQLQTHQNNFVQVLDVYAAKANEQTTTLNTIQATEEPTA